MEPVEIPILQDAYFQGPLLGKLAIPSQSPSTLLSDPQAKVPLRLFDPGYKNTIVCKTGISRVDPQGKLYYRGYDVEDLVEKSNYLEVAFLLIHGKLPSQREYDKWAYQVLHHTYLHSELEGQMKTFRYDAHPMGMFLATMASLSTFHPDANPALQGVDMYMRPKNNTTTDPADVSAKVQVTRDRAIFRMLGKSSTIAANTYRHRIGRPYNHPMPGCTNYAENILYMMDRLNEADFRPDSRLVRILDKLLILMAGKAFLLL